MQEVFDNYDRPSDHGPPGDNDTLSAEYPDADGVTADDPIEGGEPLDDDDPPRDETGSKAFLTETNPAPVEGLAAAALACQTRRRYSSSASVSKDYDRGGDYSHRLWLPAPPEGKTAEQPGYLVSTAYLDDRGYVSESGNTMDRYHYKTASGLVRLSNAGLAPFLAATGIHTSCTVNQAYYNRNCTIRIAFPSSATIAERANPLLLRHAESEENALQFEAIGKGLYSSETFIRLIAAGRYPLSQEYDTPSDETDHLDSGSHDSLQHAAAAAALSGTRAFASLRQRGQSFLDGSAYKHCNDRREMDRARGRFMYDADTTLNVMTMADVVDGSQDAIRKLGSLIGLYRGELLDSYVDEIRRNVTDRLGSGLRA